MRRRHRGRVFGGQVQHLAIVPRQEFRLPIVAAAVWLRRVEQALLRDVRPALDEIADRRSEALYRLDQAFAFRQRTGVEERDYVLTMYLPSVGLGAGGSCPDYEC